MRWSSRRNFFEKFKISKDNICVHPCMHDLTAPAPAPERCAAALENKRDWAKRWLLLGAFVTSALVHRGTAVIYLIFSRKSIYSQSHTCVDHFSMISYVIRTGGPRPVHPSSTWAACSATSSSASLQTGE